VLRGGSWNDDAGGCRSANRGNIAATNRDINIGFRCSLTIAGPLDAQAKPSEVGGGNAYSNAKPWERQGTKAGEEIVGPDGGKMVWVPAGEFTMGSAKGEGRDDEHPAHQVRIAKGFWLGKCDVTNAQFRKFCASAKHPFPTASAEGGNHPVVSVTWAEARLYCRKQGMALPTEAQWEYAARGPEGREYPWGNEWDSKKCCNDENQDWTGHAFRVGSFPEGASWCGALDMAGNVWQWCEDWYSDKYYANSSDTDPPGPDTGLCRVLRGGSWSKDADGCRSAHRGNNDPSTRDGNYGFRCLVVP
jgi:formylglycine-generating enzyme required for sulfatase activity